MASWLQNVLTVAKLIAIALIVAGGTYHIAMGKDKLQIYGALSDEV
jgi:hypothetical protein